MADPRSQVETPEFLPSHAPSLPPVPTGAPKPLGILDKMPVVSPDGKLGVIPHEDWPEAERLKFKRAMFATSPDGKLGILHPEDAVNAIQNQGFKLGQPAAQEKPALEQPGILSGIGRATKGLLYDMPKAAYEAATTAPRNPQEEAVQNASNPFGALGGKVALASKRLLVDPQVQTYQQGQRYGQAAEQAPNTAQRGALKDAAGAFKMAGAIPIVGPLAAQFAKRFQGDPLSQTANEANPYGIETDPTGALAEVGSYALAPKAIEKVKGMVAPAAKNAITAMSPSRNPSMTKTATIPSVESALFDRSQAVKQHLQAVADNYKNAVDSKWINLENSIDPALPNGAIDVAALKTKVGSVVGRSVKTDQPIPPALNDIMERGDDPMSWTEARQLRSQLGREVFGDRNLSGEAKAAGKQVYGALTDQMRKAADAVNLGDEFDQANVLHSNYLNDFVKRGSPVARALTGNNPHQIVGPLSNPASAEQAMRILGNYQGFGADVNGLRSEGAKFQSYKSGLPEQLRVHPVEVALDVPSLGSATGARLGYNWIKRAQALRDLREPMIEQPTRTPKVARATIETNPPPSTEPAAPVPPTPQLPPGQYEAPASSLPEQKLLGPKRPFFMQDATVAPTEAPQPAVAPQPEAPNPVATRSPQPSLAAPESPRMPTGRPLTPEEIAVQQQPGATGVAKDIGNWQPPPELGAFSAPDYGQKARTEVESKMGGPLKRGVPAVQAAVKSQTPPAETPATPTVGSPDYEDLKARVAQLEQKRSGKGIVGVLGKKAEVAPEVAKPPVPEQPKSTVPAISAAAKSVGEADRASTLQSELDVLKQQRKAKMDEMLAHGAYDAKAADLRKQHNELMSQIGQREDALARLRGEPTRAEKREAAKTEEEKKFGDRPAKAMKYGDIGQSQPWQVKESDYIGKRFEQLVSRYEKAIPEQEAEVAKTSATSQKGIQARANLQYWKESLQAYKDHDPRKAQEFKNEYTKLIKEAVSHGKPVPDEVIQQKSEFTLAKDARERYEKGRHTSFANRSVAVNDTMQKELGYKVKRQDGKPITDDQIKEIHDGVADVEKVFGPMHNVLRGVDLTIAHTSGKQPFLMNSVGGLFSEGDRRITIGISDILGRPVRAFAHEFGHMIDIKAGDALGVNKSHVWFKGNKRNSAGETSSLAENEDRSGENKLFRDATAKINDIREIHTLLKARSAEESANLPEDKKVEVQRAKIQLGPYWREPREVFARLFEQYVANEIGKENSASHSPQYYAKRPGWWTQEEFDKLKPSVKQAIDRRVKVLRDKYDQKESTEK